MELFYRKYGQGPPLIILHGLYGSSDNWIPIAKKISYRYTVHLPDQRNHGLSPHSPVHDYKNLVTDLLEFSNDHIQGKFYLAGHSMGGKVAAFFAVENPGKLAGLLIADISPFQTPKENNAEYNFHLDILNTLKALDLSGITSRQTIEKQLLQYIPSDKIRNFLMKNLQRKEGNKFRWKLNIPALLSNIDSIMDGLPRPSGYYPGLTGFPVTFLKGEKSSYLPENDFQDIIRIFPDAVIRKVKNAGHWLHSDKPNEVAEALLSMAE